MNRNDERKAALARQAATIFKDQKLAVSRVVAEREDERARRALNTSRLRALRLGKEAAEKTKASKRATSHEKM